MGKVGSSSITESLVNYGVWPVHQVHRLNPDHIAEVRSERERRGFRERDNVDGRGLKLHRQLIEPERPAKFISLVRDPVSRNVSAFFENFVGRNVDEWDVPNSLQGLVDAFLREYSHSVPLQWFEREPATTLGIKVYERSFLPKRGYATFQNGPFELLVLRAELPDAEKGDVIQSFLGMWAFQVQRANTSGSKEYAEKYRVFKREVELPGAYLRKMLDSRYARHFYSTEERKQVYERWSS
nr:putative capsular polysaccharide synthesis family protein [Salinibacter ruber]